MMALESSATPATMSPAVSPTVSPTVSDTASPTPAADTRRLSGQVARFAAVGVIATIVQLGLYAVLDRTMSDQWANLTSLALSTVVNTALNRRWTFAVTGAGALRQQAQAFGIFGLTWGATAGALWLLELLRPDAGTLVEVLVLALATGTSTVVRFVAMRRWIFAASGRDRSCAG